jgi:hypothetical protein
VTKVTMKFPTSGLEAVRTGPRNVRFGSKAANSGSLAVFRRNPPLMICHGLAISSSSFVCRRK